jgi:hypothetical protein
MLNGVNPSQGSTQSVYVNLQALERLDMDTGCSTPLLGEKGQLLDAMNSIACFSGSLPCVLVPAAAVYGKSISYSTQVINEQFPTKESPFGRVSVRCGVSDLTTNPGSVSGCSPLRFLQSDQMVLYGVNPSLGSTKGQPSDDIGSFKVQEGSYYPRLTTYDVWHKEASGLPLLAAREIKFTPEVEASLLIATVSLDDGIVSRQVFYNDQAGVSPARYFIEGCFPRACSLLLDVSQAVEFPHFQCVDQLLVDYGLHSQCFRQMADACNVS